MTQVRVILLAILLAALLLAGILLAFRHDDGILMSREHVTLTAVAYSPLPQNSAFSANPGGGGVGWRRGFRSNAMYRCVLPQTEQG
jgi:hypothetical protein